MTAGSGRVLITGATGFVGRALAGALGQRNVPLTLAARRPVPAPASARIAPIGDIGPTTDWGDALIGCRAVVHLAARVHVMREGEAHPLDAYRRVNTAGTLALANSAARAGVRRFVFVSTIKVNGDATTPGAPFREGDQRAPTDAYGLSKAEAEEGLLALAAATAMEISIIRPTLVYGAGARGNFASLARWVARGAPLPLGGITENRRSLIGIDNLVDLIATCLDDARAANEVFLGADGEDLSTAALVRHMAAALRTKARLIRVPPSVIVAIGTVMGQRPAVDRLCGSLQADIGKARAVLGWKPPVSIEEGLRRALDFSPEARR